MPDRMEMPDLIWPTRDALIARREAPYNRAHLQAFLLTWARDLTQQVEQERRINGYGWVRAVPLLFAHLDQMSGEGLIQKWQGFEQFWMAEVKGQGRREAHLQTQVFQTAVVMRLVQPSLPFLFTYKPLNWIQTLLPDHAPLPSLLRPLAEAVHRLPSFRASTVQHALHVAVALVLTRDLWSLNEIRDTDLIDLKNTMPTLRGGADALDAALCALGVFKRTPLRGIARKRRPQNGPTIEEYVGILRVPEPFREVSLLYVQHYRERISSRYSTLIGKIQRLAQFWRYIQDTFPELRSSADIRPDHARGFVPHCLAEAQRRARVGNSGGTAYTTTAGHALATVRTFFTDIARWSIEEHSPFKPHVPAVPPLDFRDTQTTEISQGYKRTQARLTRRVIDLEREIPKIRALAYRRWQEAVDAVRQCPEASETRRAESLVFWDWALLELLLQSGLRIEEAHHLTALDILKRNDPQGRTYFLLHVEPSKFDVGRVVPIGDSLGKVLSEIVVHVKRFYGVSQVPPVDNWDFHERTALPRAPYLLQGRTRPTMIGLTTIRDCLALLSKRAEARCHDGQGLKLAPHDCRRLFASEHLNNGTPVHVVQALLGHERLDTVMVYAKLYPHTLVEEYRKHVRGVYHTVYGPEGIRAPTAQEWAAFEHSCSLRDMGTHVCALPTGEYCPKGLVCLGCVHAQPKKSALPVFKRMLTNHMRELTRAEERQEPLGQLAARRLEIQRLEQAIRRASELSEDVASAMEAAISA